MKKIIWSIAVLGTVFGIIFLISSNNKTNLSNDVDIKIPIISNKSKVEKHYGEYVETNKITTIYDEKLKSVGKINKGVNLKLEDLVINDQTEYFKFKYNNTIYNIKYDSVDVTKKEEVNNRHKHYVPFDESIVTKKNYELYKDKKSVLKMGDKQLELPIYIKEKGSYGVVIDDTLYFIKENDVETIVERDNQTIKKATRIPTLVYHFIYDKDKTECNQEICHTFKQVESHLDALLENNFFTLTMDEFEMFLDKKLNVQKNSVLITLDDGLYAANATKIFTEHKMNLSMFIVSSWYNPKDFVSEYVEVHSHSDNLHNTGVCPIGQGGGIQCLNEDVLLKDLEKSRNKTLNTTAFCYPFYEFNEYSIRVLKKAGFTMGFGGRYEGGSYMAYPGYDKFRIPRIAILNTTTAADLIRDIM